MTTFSLTQALNILDNLYMYPEYQGVSGLTQLLADTSIKVPGASADAISLFYSGMIGDLHASELADTISAGSGGRVITINQTGQGQLLQSDNFKGALEKAAGIDEANALLKGGTLPDGIATRGLWDTVVSKNFALDAQSAISLTPNSSPDSIWARTEAPILIERGVSVNFTHGNELKQMGGPEGLKDLNFKSANLLESIRFAIGSDGQVLGVDTGNLFSSAEGSLRGYSINSLPTQLPTGTAVRTGLQQMTLAPGSTPVVASAGDPFVQAGDSGYLTGRNAEALRQGAKTYAANMPPEWLGKGLSVLGTAGLAASFIWTVDKANQQAQNGQLDEARDTMLSWTAETEGALLAGGQVAELAAPLLAGGPAGWAAYGALVLVGGVAGGLIGKSAMEHLLDANLEQASAASQQVTHSDGSVWELTRYSNGATRESLLTQPPGEAVVVYAYSSKWTMPQDGSGNYATVEVGERASDMRISNYSTVDGQPVLQNRTNTWIDDSGVAQMQMYNEQGQLISAIKDEAINAGGDTETRTGYVDGSQVNQQIKNTNAANEVSGFISGSGAIINIDHASISFADGASASLNGLGNVVFDAANNRLGLAKADGLSISSIGHNLTAVGSSLSVSITGENNTAVIDGEYNTLAVNGNSNYEMIYGNNNNTAVYGSNNNTTAIGTSNTTTVYGSYDTTKSIGIGNYTQSLGSNSTTEGYGTGNNTQSFGNNDTTISNGTANVTLSYGSGDNTRSYGDGNNTESFGTADTTIASGTNNTTLSYGNGDSTLGYGDSNNTQSVGNNDTTIGNGTANVTLNYGDNGNTRSYGTGNYTQSLGRNNTTESNGNYNTTQSYGYGDSTLAYGTGNNTQSFGNNDTTIASGTNNTTLSYGNNDNTQSYGEGNNTESFGTADTTLASGTNNTTLSHGYGDNTQAYGTGNNTQSVGNNDTTIGNGTANFTINYGDNGSTRSYGISNYTQSSGSNSTTESHGNYNTTLSYGYGDNTLAYGTGNNTQSLGNNDTTIASGTNNTTLSYGNNDNTQSYGEGNNTQSFGTADTTLANGTNNTTLSYGYGDNTQAYGDGNNTQSLGNYNTTIGHGASNFTLSGGDNGSTRSYGIGNDTQSLGSNNTTESNGNYNTTHSYGDGGTTLGYGDGNNTRSYGNSDTTIANGTNNTTLSYSDNNTTQSYGTGNDTQSLGSNNTTESNGNYNTTHSYGDGDTTQAYGDSNNTRSYGNSDTTIANGTNNTTLSYNDNNTTQSSGTGNNTQSLGSNNTTESNGDYNATMSGGTGDSAYANGIYNDIYSLGNDASAWTDVPVDSGAGSNVPVDSGVDDCGYYHDASGELVIPICYDSSLWESLFGDWGFAGNKTRVDELIGGTQSALAQYQLKQGKIEEAAFAQQAFADLKQTLAANTGQAVYEAVHWKQPVITWSMAQQGSEFSRYMDSEQETAIAQAFTVWSEASGLQFQEVTDSTQANIRFGWGDFNTAETGVIGLTTLGVSHDRLKQQAIVRLEDSRQDALLVGQTGELTYSGTDATFSQVLLHEIGHALGLADSTDQNSIEYYYLGGENRTLSASDRETIQALYGTTQQAIVAGNDQLIQAMAGFGVSAAAQTSLSTAANDTYLQPLLVASNL